MVGCEPPSTSPTPAETAPPASSAIASPVPTVGATARIVAAKQLDSRSIDLTIESPAVGGPVQVRLLLPADFETQPKRRWPVLYLLHGCCDTYLSWTRSTDIEQLTGKRDLLVVMPDGGKVGFYSNWRNGPQWETFHTEELPELLTSQYRANEKAAIAGVSMGGLGALGYAARHPGKYTAVASFSGIVHTRLSSDESQGYLGLVSSQERLTPWRFGATRRSTLQPGSNTTRTTSHPSSSTFRCSSRRAMDNPVPWMKPALLPTPSSPRSTPRTRSSSSACTMSARTSESTCTATAPTTGCIGNANCTAPGPSSPTNSNRHDQTGASVRPELDARQTEANPLPLRLAVSMLEC
jgi:S-formylglutathione hydrolase FrmB